MWFTSWLRECQPSAARKYSRRPSGKRRRFRPGLDALDSRVVPSTLTVTSNLGFGPGTLRTEIGIATSGDTIVFDQQLRGQTIDIETNPPFALGGSYELVIDKNLDIEGPGAANLAINGENLARVFRVTAGVQVTLSGLTIENGNGRAGGWDPGYGDGQGGEILNEGTLTVSGCVLSGDSVNANAYYYGGGIYNAGTLTVSASTVTHSIAGQLGGGIYNAGTLTLSGSNVSANFAYSWGGGIYNAGTLAVSGSTVTNNVAQEDGGGIYNLGTLTVSGSTVTNNVAWRDGGGIYNASRLTILNSTVIDNSAPDGADVFTNHHFTNQNNKIGKISTK
jgi:hypothetical protein